MKILENQELILSNLISFRKKMSQEEIQVEMMAIDKYLKENDTKVNGHVITTSHSYEEVNGEIITDTEILIPIDKAFNNGDKYIFKKKFKLKNALSHRFEGEPHKLQSSVIELINYMAANKLQQITSIYCVQIGVTKESQLISDVYVGVSENIL